MYKDGHTERDSHFSSAVFQIECLRVSISVQCEYKNERILIMHFKMPSGLEGPSFLGSGVLPRVFSCSHSYSYHNLK